MYCNCFITTVEELLKKDLSESEGHESPEEETETKLMSKGDEYKKLKRELLKSRRAVQVLLGDDKNKVCGTFT